MLKGTPKEIPPNTLAKWDFTPTAPQLHTRIFARWEPRTLKKAWKRLCKSTNFTDLRFYDLRPTFSTALQNYRVVYEFSHWLMGHKIPGKTGDYSHGGQQWNRMLRQAVTVLD